jgi:hypothetical protein
MGKVTLRPNPPKKTCGVPQAGRVRESFAAGDEASADRSGDARDQTADFRRGKRLGNGDHIVRWLKPTKPRSIHRPTYDGLPEFLTIRETRVRIKQAGFRTQTLLVATALLDSDDVTKDDLEQLYRARWNAELDLRSLKRTLQMAFCGAKHRKWFGRKSGRTSWPTISSVQSWLKPTGHRTAIGQLQGSGSDA